jgi:FkbM family methyltransferase
MSIGTLAKNVLLHGVRALPARAKRTIFAELAKTSDADFGIAGDIARRAGLTGFVAEGDSGVIRGALDDEAALAKYARERSWSPNERSLFKNLFAEYGGTYLDIGANIGLTLIPISQNSHVECYAFEPDPTNFRYLSENVSVNCHAKNVRLLNLALYNKETTVPFEISEGHSGDNRLSLTESAGQLGEQNRKRILVAAKRLDDVVDNPVRPIAAKIDVQGAEPFVIEGGQKNLSQAQLLSLEFWPYSMLRMDGDVDGLITFLTENFQEGSVSIGDKDEQVSWRPISSVSSLLQKCQQSPDPSNYLDVIVRKTDHQRPVR